MPARFTGDEVKGLTDREDNPKIKRHSPPFACGAWNALQVVGDVRLRPLIKFHIGVDREGVAAFHAACFPFAIRLHAATVNRKGIGFADRTPDRAEPRFDLFRRHSHHQHLSFQVNRLRKQYSDWNARSASRPKKQEAARNEQRPTKDTVHEWMKSRDFSSGMV